MFVKYNMQIAIIDDKTKKLQLYRNSLFVTAGLMSKNDKTKNPKQISLEIST